MYHWEGFQLGGSGPDNEFLLGRKRSSVIGAGGRYIYISYRWVEGSGPIVNLSLGQGCEGSGQFLEHSRRSARRDGYRGRYVVALGATF